MQINKVAALQGNNFIEKILQQKCFGVDIAKFLRTAILKNICDIASILNGFFRETSF